MDSITFKSQLSKNKSFLLGKVINVSLITSNGVERFSFVKLKDFGNKILELEKLGAGFGFSTVENDMVSKRIVTDVEFNKWLGSGNWTKINITASLI